MNVNCSLYVTIKEREKKKVQIYKLASSTDEISDANDSNRVNETRSAIIIVSNFTLPLLHLFEGNIFL